MMTDKDAPQVTNYDHDELLFEAWCNLVPRITTALAYAAAVRLIDRLTHEVERFEKSAAFVRITGAQ